MGKKYIIDLNPDCVEGEYLRIPARIAGEEQWLVTKAALTPYTEPDLGQVRKKAYKIGYEKGYRDGVNRIGDAEDKIRKEAYDEGYDDAKGGYENGFENGMIVAWDAARKIWKYDTTTLRAIFGEGIMRMDWFMNLTAAEAIEKIRQYEQEKEEIKVGDEVELKCGVRPAIYMQGTKGSDEIYLLFNDGSCGLHSKSEIVRKTGRHFPEIATILEKMRGEQDG